ncbi:MAG: protein-glutamate O-methyltransferase CheR [Anaerolineales bacterium]|nr:protein-glutamate O-methyltransferase CheR [Anaerolineales bacterium]
MELDTYAQVKYQIKAILNIDLDYYKDQQMRRRLDSWLVRSGAPSWENYFHRIRGDMVESGHLRDYLTINVSAFFRDPERWQSLKDTVLPRLLKEASGLRPHGGLRIWSAGCSIGPEPYSLAMIMAEISPYHRHYILAADLDRGALTKAIARGPYTGEDLQHVSPVERTTFFEPDGPPYYVNKQTAKEVEFGEQNIITDPFDKDFDLIVCRNVVIYFTAETKDLLYKKFQTALRQGGVLFVGATEIIPRPQDIGFRSQGVSFYVKI